MPVPQSEPQSEQPTTASYYDNNWKTEQFRGSVVSKIDEVIERAGIEVVRTSSEMEKYMFSKANSREQYMNMIAKLILHIREMSQPAQN